VRIEDWRYIDSTGIGKGEWIILRFKGNGGIEYLLLVRELGTF